MESLAALLLPTNADPPLACSTKYNDTVVKTQDKELPIQQILMNPSAPFHSVPQCTWQPPSLVSLSQSQTYSVNQAWPLPLLMIPAIFHQQ